MSAIEKLLNSLQNPDMNGLSPSEIWDKIISKNSPEDIGFSDPDDMKEWMKNNPYENLK